LAAGWRRRQARVDAGTVSWQPWLSRLCYRHCRRCAAPFRGALPTLAVAAQVRPASTFPASPSGRLPLGTLALRASALRALAGSVFPSAGLQVPTRNLGPPMVGAAAGPGPRGVRRLGCSSSTLRAPARRTSALAALAVRRRALPGSALRAFACCVPCHSKPSQCACSESRCALARCRPRDSRPSHRHPRAVPGLRCPINVRVKGRRGSTRRPPLPQTASLTTRPRDHERYQKPGRCRSRQTEQRRQASGEVARAGVAVHVNLGLGAAAACQA